MIVRSDFSTCGRVSQSIKKNSNIVYFLQTWIGKWGAVSREVADVSIFLTPHWPLRLSLNWVPNDRWLRPALVFVVHKSDAGNLPPAFAVEEVNVIAVVAEII